tara:strand:- start:1148 stop:1636 length:489 start_codon:yes stop_codon:yes gene_type:complete
MIFKKRHNSDLYNTLLSLSRNIFFYKSLEFKDTYETRIYLMFFHYSIVLFIQKARGDKPDQENYNNLFFYIENNLRELGFGDVSVNKKMKELNKIFYDILVKLSLKTSPLELNKLILIKYFEKLKNNDRKMQEFELYLNDFYKFCFELSSKNMIQDIKNFKY